MKGFGILYKGGGGGEEEVCYGIHVSLLYLLHDAHRQGIGGSLLKAWAYSPVAFKMALCLSASLLW